MAYIKILKIVIILLAIIGSFVLSTMAHEMKHYYDVKDESSVFNICFFEINVPLDYPMDSYIGGSVSHYGEAVSSELTADIIKYIVLLILLIIIFSYMVKENENSL